MIRKKNVRGRVLVRKPLMLLLTAFIFIAGAGITYADSSGFTDVLWLNGYYDSTLGDMAGRRLYVYGLADNLAENTGNPRDDLIDLASGEPINRLEVAELLYRLCGTATPAAGLPFTDVPEESREAVAWMYATGVTRGVSEDLYGTGEVTRVQFLTMLSRLFAWENEPSGLNWGELGYEERMTVLARENGMLPAGLCSEGFTHGDVYLILLSLAEREFPERLRPVRAEMSRPYQITLDAASFLDAEEQIAVAVSYAPTRICVNFSKSCPAVDLKAFQEAFTPDDAGRPFTFVISTAYQKNYVFSRQSLFRYALIFHDYAPAYLADVDAVDWLRCFEDERYSQSITAFLSREIQPLIERSLGDYAKASAAQELVCRLASYDWNEYEAIKGQGFGIHTEAHSISGFLDGGVIVCDGYAKAYQWICCCLGLDCFVVYGKGNNESHAWNKVHVDGVWYNADVCWADTGSGNSYFLKSDEYFKGNWHSFRDDYVLTEYASVENYSAW